MPEILDGQSLEVLQYYPALLLFKAFPHL